MKIRISIMNWLARESNVQGRLGLIAAMPVMPERALSIIENVMTGSNESLNQDKATQSVR
jgi:hypothetical protein